MLSPSERGRGHEEAINMLDEKVAVIYGAGSIGSAVAKAFVAAGSQVYVASRT